MELLLVVDEAATYVTRARHAHDGKGDPEPVEALHEIARLGRTARVHLLVGLQRPDAVFLSGEARDNYAARLAVGQMGPEGARMMFGQHDAAQELDGTRKGRGLYAVNGQRQSRPGIATRAPRWLPAEGQHTEEAPAGPQNGSERVAAEQS